MARITIDLEQGQERLNRLEGRRLSFPDGLDRIITLPRREWLMYDELCRHWVYPGLFEGDIFETAHEYGEPVDAGFEASLGHLFSVAVEINWSVLNEGLYGVANENDTYTR